MAIAIRDLEAGDQARIAEVDGGPAWNSNPLLWERYLEEQSRGERDVLLAVRGDAILAYGSLIWVSTYPPFKGEGIPEINNLVVAAAERRQGVASQLIAALELRARLAGRPVIGIGVGLYADYGAAQRLYPKLGYRPDGRGITYHEHPVAPGSSVPVDDDLVLWMTRRL